MRSRIVLAGSGRVTCVNFPSVGACLQPVERAAAPAAANPTEAERKAKTLVEKARSEAAAIRQAALEAGRAEAVERYSGPLAAALAAAEGLKRSMEKAGEEALRGAEREMARLAVRVAEKVIRRKLETDPDEVFLMVSRAVQAVPRGGAMLIKVNDKDFENIQKAGGVIPEIARLSGGLSMEVSAEVEPGGCIVVTEGGAVNANPSRQLELIEGELLKEVPGGL